jgi:hypothetical protein
MWPHKDLGWWAFVLTVVGLVLLVPASIVANLITPKLKDWWAGRSLISLTNRIVKVRRSLEEMEKFPTLTETEDQILRNIATTCFLIFAVGYFMLTVVAVSMLVATQIFFPNEPYKLWHIISLATMWWILLMYFYRRRILQMRRYRHPRSPQVRADMKNSIAKLEAELQRKHGNGSGGTFQKNAFQ